MCARESSQKILESSNYKTHMFLDLCGSVRYSQEQVTAGAAAQLREGMGSLKGGVSETRDGLVLPPDTIYHLGFVGKDWEICCLWGPVVLSIVLFQRVIILVRMCVHGLRRLVGWDVCARTGEASGSGRVCTDEGGY